tara:strand:+ start:114 stop:458 length:345 start_codon:yes stop_codon:yes gene_type:complete
MELSVLKSHMEAKAKEAAESFLIKHYVGQDWGACGFAWVKIQPEHKGNTKLGKIERKKFEALGATKDCTGKAWEIWNPSTLGCQNIDAKEEGARVAAEILCAEGYDARMGSRLD